MTQKTNTLTNSKIDTGSLKILWKLVKRILQIKLII